MATSLIRAGVAAVVAAGVMVTGSACVSDKPFDGPSPAPSLSAEPIASPTGTETPSPSPSSASPSSPSPSASRQTPTRPPATHSPPPAKVTQAELRAALLTGSDLSGFHAGGDPGGSGGDSGCSALDADYMSGAQPKAEALLTRGSAGPFVRERIGVMSASTAAGRVSRLRRALSECAHFKGDDASLGGPVDYTVTSLDVPSYGDGTASLRLTIKPQNIAVTLYQDIVVMRRAGILIVISHTAAGSIDGGITRSAAKRAFAKLPRP
ncbi:hypothetical protein [Catellatospora chokoriensis]|uniref:PknH-like extracellular domain-containing protein n=1 Tax=Catellatospora chokoriensis TaxID=310353 RepID=A0A8J3KCJ3_9ACTN|nr:hypothetical protein [Catellatospora chokoriensis]GIF94278.1 hypothetical protein Cch02nite_77220 [Catellatospora chokoriensis]